MDQNTNKNQAVLIKYARKHLGEPYKFGAKPWEAPATFDCSSFVQYLYKRIEINLPRTALDQASIGKKVDKDKLEVGDLLFFKGGWGHYNPQFPLGIGHVGIYIGSGKVIDARSKEISGKELGSVIEEDIKEFTSRPDFITAQRILK